MNRSDLELLRGAIQAGLQFEYPTAFGKTAMANPHDVVQRHGTVYLHFIKRDGAKVERKLDSCFAIVGTPGFKELDRAGLIKLVTSKAGKIQ